MTIAAVKSVSLSESRVSSGFRITGNILKIKRWGIHLNREIEVNYSHRNYQMEFGPRRNRLTHSLLFEEFEVVMENW
jgi:hypothetical protein